MSRKIAGCFEIVVGLMLAYIVVIVLLGIINFLIARLIYG